MQLKALQDKEYARQSPPRQPSPKLRVQSPFSRSRSQSPQQQFYKSQSKIHAQSTRAAFKPIKPTRRALSTRLTAPSVDLLPDADQLAYNAQPDDLAFLDQPEPEPRAPEPTPPVLRSDLTLSQLQRSPSPKDAEMPAGVDSLSPVAKSVLRDPRPSAASVTDFRLKFYDQLKVYEEHGLCRSWKDRVLMGAAFLRHKLETLRNVLDLQVARLSVQAGVLESVQAYHVKLAALIGLQDLRVAKKH